MTTYLCDTCRLIVSGFDERESGLDDFLAKEAKLHSNWPNVDTVFLSIEPEFMDKECDGCGESLPGDRYKAEMMESTDA